MLVAGVIAAWDRVWAHDYGFRAQRAQVIALLKPELDKSALGFAGSDYVAGERWVTSVLPALAETAGVPIVEEYELAELIRGTTSSTLAIPRSLE
jgi:hypothetical protein